MTGLDLFDSALEAEIRQEVIEPVSRGEYVAAMAAFPAFRARLHANIPEKKRISYGRYYTVKVLGETLYTELAGIEAPAFEFAVFTFERSEDFDARGVALQMISLRGLERFEEAAPYFEASAADEHWEVREFASGFFRKLVKAHPDESREFYLRLVHSPDSNVRRFVSESLRPVQENRWFHKDPNYPLSILRHLFYESVAYPRASVGNNLSDWARRRPNLVYGIVEELVASGDKNAYWIATRACRNLVKKEPLKVMDLLGVDEYRYKKRIYRRSEFT